MIKKFVWGDNFEKKIIHLVAWDHIDTNKEIRGLRIHSLKLNNEAFL